MDSNKKVAAGPSGSNDKPSHRFAPKSHGGWKEWFAGGKVFQRVSPMPWAEQFKKIRFQSLFTASGAAMLGAALSFSSVGQLKKQQEFEFNAIPREKPSFIIDWEKKYS